MDKGDAMKRRMAVLAAAILSILPGVAGAQEKTEGQTLVVKLKYKGKGTVDEKHKVYLLVIDNDPYSADVLADASSTKPIDPAQSKGKKIAYILQRQGAASKEQELTFKGLKSSPVYVVAFFDQAGTYEQTQGPASGSPSGQYGSTPFKPDPIKLKEGKPTEVKVQFDDSSKTP
jgi:hypothetical protein